MHDDRLAHLRRDFPDWEPWLGVMKTVLSEMANASWQAYVPQRLPAPNQKAPFLSGAQVNIEPAEASRWVEQLFRVAGERGSNLATLKIAAKRMRADGVALLHASLCQNEKTLEDMAQAFGAEPRAFRAVADLAPLPLLHACRRRWNALISESWSQGYCPICGAWPVLAEEQGIERDRRLRCGRCGAGWRGECLRCVFCEITEHTQLAALVQPSGSDARRVEVCKRCLGYVKILMVLRSAPGAQLLIEDLSTVDLDIAALEQSYRRPATPGYEIGLRVNAAGASVGARLA